MNRRRLLQSVPALAGVGWMQGAIAQGSPVASPLGSPGALALPVGYSDVSRQYGELAGRLLETGRSAVDQLLAANFDTLFARFSPDLQAAVPKAQMSLLLQQLTVNQVTFEVPDYQLVFDAELSGDTLSGSVQSQGVTPFTAQRGAGTPQSSPIMGTPTATMVLAGQWKGSTQLPDGTELPFELSFASDGASGTLSIPDQHVIDAPLADIEFDAERPLGERTADNAMPHSPDLQVYWARCDWGGRGLMIDLVVDAGGTITGMQLTPEWQLPPDPAVDLPAPAPVQLPFAGLWWTYWGGETEAENYHAVSPQQRHAVDLMIWNDGATFHDDPSRNENYWVWGQPVLAPADGTVVDVVDAIGANTPGSLPENPGDVAGNHVVLQIDEGVYLFLAHMQAGSIQVAVGDTITTGTVLGLTGNSGNSSEPHLHIHAQNEPDLTSPTAIGLPISFANVLVNGEMVAEAAPRQGRFIAQG